MGEISKLESQVQTVSIKGEQSPRSRSYRLRRWWFIHVGWLGINDPDDVVGYFEIQRRLIKEVEDDRLRLFVVTEKSNGFF